MSIRTLGSALRGRSVMRICALAVVAALAVFAAGCGSDSDSGGSGDSEGSDDPSGQRSVRSSPPWKTRSGSATSLSRRRPRSSWASSWSVVDGQNDGSKMLNAAQNLIARDVDGMIHVAYFDTGRPVLTAAKKAGIPVAIADTSPEGIEPQSDGFDNYIAFMGPNDEQAGYDEAKALFSAAGDDVKVFGLEGTLGTSVNEGRVAGPQEGRGRDGRCRPRRHPDRKVPASGSAGRDDERPSGECGHQCDLDRERRHVLGRSAGAQAGRQSAGRGRLRVGHGSERRCDRSREIR